MAPNTTKGAYDSTPADPLWEEFSQYLCRAIDTMNSMLEGLHTPSPFSVGHEAYKAEKERQDSFVQGQLSITRQDFQSAKGCLAQLKNFVMA